jgi:hypothetical protein
LQRCLLTSAAGREQGGRQHVRRQDYRQEGAQGQGGLTRERDQGSQEVILNTHLLFMIAEIKGTVSRDGFGFDEIVCLVLGPKRGRGHFFKFFFCSTDF